MTSRERVLAALGHREPDRVPFDALRAEPAQDLLATMDLPDDVRAGYARGDVQYVRFAANRDPHAFESYLPGLPEGAGLSDFGVGRVAQKSVEGFHAGHRMFHPLASVDTVSELERFPFPDMTAPWRHAHLADRVREAQTQGFAVIGQMSQTILETAYEMRGIERLMTDFYERPGYVEALFEKIAEQRRFQARTYAEAGCDVVRIGDDIAAQQGLLVSPATYREWIRPHHAEVIAIARRAKPNIHVLYHSDGNLTALLPDLIEIGVTAINPVQPECMDPAEIKRHFGRDLALWGCTAVQSVYATGTRGDVLDEIRTRMRTVAPGGGYLVQFMNIILTDRVLQNLRHFFEAFHAMTAYG